MAERLYAWWDFAQHHTKELIALGAVLLIAIVVVHGLIGRSKQQNIDAMTGYIMAELLYEQAEQLAVSGDAQRSVEALQAAYSLARDVAGQNRNRSWGRRAAILAARIGILTGREEEVMSSMLDLLSSRPSTDIANEARLHLAIAQENRGGENDLAGAAANYERIISTEPEGSIVRANAMMGMARLEMRSGDYDAAGRWLEEALVLQADTSEYERYLLETIEWETAATATEEG